MKCKFSLLLGDLAILYYRTKGWTGWEFRVSEEMLAADMLSDLWVLFWRISTGTPRRPPHTYANVFWVAFLKRSACDLRRAVTERLENNCKPVHAVETTIPLPSRRTKKNEPSC